MVRPPLLVSVPPTATVLPPSPPPVKEMVSMLKVPLLVRSTPEAVSSAVWLWSSRSPALPAAVPVIMLSAA